MRITLTFEDRAHPGLCQFVWTFSVINEIGRDMNIRLSRVEYQERATKRHKYRPTRVWSMYKHDLRDARHDGITVMDKPPAITDGILIALRIKVAQWLNAQLDVLRSGVTS